MFNYFAHAGHDHSDEDTQTTATVAQTITSQPPDLTPILISGGLLVAVCAVVIGVSYLSRKKSNGQS